MPKEEDDTAKSAALAAIKKGKINLSGVYAAPGDLPIPKLPNVGRREAKRDWREDEIECEKERRSWKAFQDLANVLKAMNTPEYYSAKSKLPPKPPSTGREK